MKILDKIKSDHQARKTEEMSLEDYLKLAKKDPSVYNTPAQRLLKAIGEPAIIETHKNPKLSRLFLNKNIKVYAPFSDFFGMEETIERVVDFVKHAAQGLEESKAILYLLGPVGSAKSTLAHRLRKIFETQPFFMVKGSPVQDDPLALFDKDAHGDMLEKEFGIPKSRLGIVQSGWLQKRIKELDGDISKLKVVKVFPSMQTQLANARTEPADETNQDVSTLVGKMNIRQLEKFDQNDPDAYLYSGGLNKSNQGILEFVEMFKAPIKTLNPLLAATQDHMYAPSEGMASLPFQGIILAHSNESEWSTFKNDQSNEAFLDRVFIVKVPYVLRYDEEKKIYKKLLDNSDLKKAPVAPFTLDFLAKFIVLSRLVEDPTSRYMTKLLVYNGESSKDKDARAKPLLEYKSQAGINEGMDGLSTRFAFKVLSKTFNFDSDEVAANPVHLMQVLTTAVKQEGFDEEKEIVLMEYIGALEQEYIEKLAEDVVKAYFSSSDDWAQNMFDQYIEYAQVFIDEGSYFDKKTGATLDLDEIDEILASMETAAGINGSKSFRQDVCYYAARHREKHGKNPRWDSYEKIKHVIEKRLLINVEEILPVISTTVHKSNEDSQKYQSFKSSMKEQGYTDKQIELLTSYYVRTRKA